MLLKKSDYQNSQTFYCFSPPVMLATFLIEFGLATFVFLKTRLRTLPQRLGFIILILLGVFQLVEFQICRSYDANLINTYARIGLVAITFLPSLGLHLSSAIVKHKRDWYVYVSYIFAFGWALYFGLVNNSVVSGICGANYSIFELSERTGFLWGTYYIGLLFIGIWEAYSFSQRKKYKKYKTQLLYLVGGYLTFMLPSFVITAIYPAASNALPSVMCGFAVLLAFILTFKVISVNHSSH